MNLNSDKNDRKRKEDKDDHHYDDGPPKLKKESSEFIRSPPYDDFIIVDFNSFAVGADCEKYCAQAKHIKIQVKIIRNNKSKSSSSSSVSTSDNRHKHHHRRHKSHKSSSKSHSRSSSSSHSKDKDKEKSKERISKNNGCIATNVPVSTSTILESSTEPPPSFRSSFTPLSKEIKEEKPVTTIPLYQRPKAHLTDVTSESKQEQSGNVFRFSFTPLSKPKSRDSIPLHRRPKATPESESAAAFRFSFSPLSAKKGKTELAAPEKQTASTESIVKFGSFKIPKKKTPEQALLCSYTSILKVKTAPPLPSIGTEENGENPSENESQSNTQTDGDENQIQIIATATPSIDGNEIKKKKKVQFLNLPNLPEEPMEVEVNTMA